MQYLYAPKQSYEDLASGRVIYGHAGMATFPVRLALEIFHRSLAHLGSSQVINVYDPLCGQAYLLTVLGFLAGEKIHSLTGSDIDPEAVEAAQKNLALLSLEGLEARRSQLRALWEQHQKASHKEALESIENLRALLSSSPLPTKVFEANALENGLIGEISNIPDLVLADVPYGQLASWKGQEASPLTALLDVLYPILKSSSIVALVFDKSQKVAHSGYGRVERFQVGKRKIELLRKKA